MRLNRVIATAAASILAATGLVACSDSADNTAGEGGDDKVIRIGTTDSDQKAWSVFVDKAKEEGIDLELVPFTEYTPVNPALAEGQIDLNKFQHILYLAQYEASSGEDLRIVGSAEINTLGLFWKDHDSLDGIEGEKIAIPNDPSNQGRAINVLVQAGLVKVKEGADELNPTPADIDEEGSKVEITPVDASQTPTAYNQGDPAIINNNWLSRAGIDASTAVASDDPNSELAEPYINIFAVRAEDIDNPTYEKLVEIWQTPEVTDALNEDSNGTAVQVQKSKDELNEILDRLVEESK
ncbi:D-methionine transport system substrate-binding protein [Corynebacterium appendicis CIP 107643]|uniref:D-methionine transport system substrate-binding protein n=1 Tax=Corynebacterium appendicis CIP 107643 TaxID=1161099 RepID=A0A1N7JAZ9_9CORY|nr:MetQ/NlpA family ABC transporter substrate-binding protein [Corynebacterium appendicis]MCT1684163.1 MetQ/NlpA family ABC transporter substrate-binding protein [Corynebacterium appendicis]MDK8626281.1 MetQ/NlpA family ABC transporter substrate-binding protein [Corynebacterium appendicis]WJY60341.1 D-methionine-binding lipoprotein MetQ precursor [Corynebacterium appendicis CIP 107643]SIS46562.1 D-methionine transport system substrate-binding protein [Corynebacterium appendicis CIP 107643]